MKFKVGDKVRVITNDYEPCLSLGDVLKIHTVDYEEEGYYLEKDDTTYWADEGAVEAVGMKGWELLKEISEGNIKEGTKLKLKSKNRINECEYTVIYENGAIWFEEEEVYSHCLLGCEFEIIEEQEEQEEIKIQEIPEATGTYFDSQKGYNTLLQAIKQLDKKIKEENYEI